MWKPFNAAHGSVRRSAVDSFHFGVIWGVHFNSKYFIHPSRGNLRQANQQTQIHINSSFIYTQYVINKKHRKVLRDTSCLAPSSNFNVNGRRFGKFWFEFFWFKVTISKIFILVSLVTPVAISGKCRCVFGPHGTNRSRSLFSNLMINKQAICNSTWGQPQNNSPQFR